MDSLVKEVRGEFDFQDFDSLAQALDDDEMDTDAFNHPLSDDLVPYRPLRVTSYAGSPGALVMCPSCGLGGKRVDRWGAYWCEGCGYSNAQERPTP